MQYQKKSIKGACITLINLPKLSKYCDIQFHQGNTGKKHKKNQTRD